MAQINKAFFRVDLTIASLLIFLNISLGCFLLAPLVSCLKAQPPGLILFKVQNLKLVYPFITDRIDVPVLIVYGTN